MAELHPKAWIPLTNTNKKVSWWSPMWLQPCWSGWGLVQVWEPSRPVTCKHSAAEKHFQTWNIWKTAAARHPNMYVLANVSCKYSVIVHRANTLWKHRMYFMNSSENHLLNDLIWLSDMPCAAAVVAAPIRKLCDLNCLGQKWQNCRAPRSCSLNLARVTGTLGQYRYKDLL